MMKQSILFGFGAALLSLGLAVGGYLTGRRAVESETAPIPVPVLATASSESDGVVLATGAYGASVEAMYYLDSQSGRLSGALISRDAPTFQKTFSRNVKNDLVEATKQLGIPLPAAPKFLMVTGDSDVRQVGSRSGYSKSFAYVAEINSGVVLVYALTGSNDRDLAVASGTIEFWTFARLNDGLQSVPTISVPAVEQRQDEPVGAPNLIDADFYRSR
ncbi:MAG: hypothetical protein HUK22_02325 [Thermoguttaceae bacterium]|nr:hypothetical protein [Thermoguttaceae bacterium]